jgi:hypothetical protein
MLGLALTAPMLTKRLVGNDPLAHGQSRQVWVTRMIYDRDSQPGRGEDDAAYDWRNRLAQRAKLRARARRTGLRL